MRARTISTAVLVLFTSIISTSLSAQTLTCSFFGSSFEIGWFTIPEEGGAILSGSVTSTALGPMLDGCETPITGSYDGVNLLVNLDGSSCGLCADTHWPDLAEGIFNCSNGSCSGDYTPTCDGVEAGPSAWFISFLGDCTLTGDTDNDGVSDSLDECPGTTVPESVPTRSLGTNRWALVNGDTSFDTNLPKGGGPGKSYTLEDTHGCSCSQIIAELELGTGHTKYGCSSGVMDAWVALMDESEAFDPSCADATVAALQ